MENVNKDFDIPYYIFEEIIEYITLDGTIEQRKEKSNNLNALLRLSIINRRLTKEQVIFLKDSFCEE